MKTMLVPLDGSDLAQRAVPFAATLAARAGSSLLLLRAVQTLSAPTEAAGEALRREAQSALDATAAALVAEGLTVSTRVVDRQPESAILEAAAEEDVDLLVMSTHGRGGFGRFIYGSVADTVLRHAPVPVVTVPPHGLDRWPADGHPKILVPLDGSALSLAALAPARELAEVLGGSLLLASVVTFPSYGMYAEGYVFVDPDPNDSVIAETRRYLQSVADPLTANGLTVETCATYGSPYFGLMSIAREHGAGMIVMATHGRGGIGRALLGSVATAAIRQTDVPILLVRPDEIRQQEETPLETVPPPAQPAIAAEPEAAIPAAALSLSEDELGTLTRLVGDALFNEPITPAAARPLRDLLEKLRTARSDLAAPAHPATRAPARAGV